MKIGSKNQRLGVGLIKMLINPPSFGLGLTVGFKGVFLSATRRIQSLLGLPPAGEGMNTNLVRWLNLATPRAATERILRADCAQLIGRSTHPGAPQAATILSEKLTSGGYSSHFVGKGVRSAQRAASEVSTQHSRSPPAAIFAAPRL